MNDERRTEPAAPRTLRFVAPGPGSPLGQRFGSVAFHERLTVLDTQDDDVAALLGELRVPGPDLIVSIDGGPEEALGGAATRAAPWVVLDAATLDARLAQTIVGARAELGRQAAELDAGLAAARSRRETAAAHVTALCVRVEAARHTEELDDDDGFIADPRALADELAALDAELADLRPRATIVRELKKWERVTDEARTRLVQIRESGLRVEPADLSEATRLRNEWQYAEQVHRELRRRRSRRDVEESRTRFEQFLARYGATSYEDLSVVGTGFGNTEADLAIREAATVVSMAEQQCIALQHELEACDPTDRLRRRASILDRATAFLGHAPGADPISELRRAPAARTAAIAMKVDSAAIRALTTERDAAIDAHERVGLELQVLEEARVGVERIHRDLSHDSSDRFGSLGPVAVEALLRKALEDGVDGDVVVPVVIDRALSAAAPAARRRAFEVIVEHSRTRQVVLAAKTPDVLDWARALGPENATVWSVEAL